MENGGVGGGGEAGKDVAKNYHDTWIYLCRVPEDGYYMFTLVVREPGGTNAAGTILVNGVDVLCRAEQGEHAWQTGTCTVRLRRLQH